MAVHYRKVAKLMIRCVITFAPEDNSIIAASCTDETSRKV